MDYLEYRVVMFYTIIFGTTRHFWALQKNNKVTSNRYYQMDVQPALEANRFIESSPSPWERTWPQSTNVVDVERARPLASTSAMLICTEAWSLEVMRRSAERRINSRRMHGSMKHTGRWALAGNIEVDEDTLYMLSLVHNWGDDCKVIPDRFPLLLLSLMLASRIGERCDPWENRDKLYSTNNWS